MKDAIPALLIAALAGQAGAQTTLHYWDFTAMTDVVGGVPTSAVGSPTISGAYGEAYPGAGTSLNTVLGGTGSGGGYLLADVHDGSAPTALAFSAADDFAFSYWCYDDTGDGDVRGPRVIDSLAGTDEGIQLGTNATNIYNLRFDDAGGGSLITNNNPPYDTVMLPADKWTHVVVNVSRTSGLMEAFFDGVSQGTLAFTLGAIAPTMDLQIGVINGGTNAGQAQACGLDDLAFYDGVLGAADIAGLAAGTLTPLDFAPCPPVTAAEVVRLGTPPNAAAFLPGVTSGPVIGMTWDPTLDNSIATASALNILAITSGPLNLPTPEGTILCTPVGPVIIRTANPGNAFQVVIPNDCTLAGIPLCSQGIALNGDLSFTYYNALDITIGTF